MKTVKKIPKYGDQSSDVETLQEGLNLKINADLSVDGDFRGKTLAAVVKAQKQAGLQGTGVIGVKTLAFLGIQVEKSVATGPVLDAPKAPVVVPPSMKGITRQVIADKIIEIMDKDIKGDYRETHGKNRSPDIDRCNKQVGVVLGSPYCASVAWDRYNQACKELGLKNPIPKTASSQDFRRSSFVPAEYIHNDKYLGRKGDVGVLQVATDSARGHHTTLSEDMRSQPFFKTAEYNTDGSGSRDGDGAYYMMRSTKDGVRENSGKLFISFADIPQWIFDYNAKLQAKGA